MKKVINPSVALIGVEAFKPHPDNPRKGDDSEYIKQLAADMELNGYSIGYPIYARTTRRSKGVMVYQVISGHRRLAAAILANRATIPTILAPKDITDLEVHAELMKANNGKELTKVEQALHILKGVKLGEKGGAGNKGGVSEYARLCGDKETTVRRLRNAGEVLSSLNKSAIMAGFFEHKITQLDYIKSHVAEECWKEWANKVADEGLSMKELKEALAEVNEQMPEPEQEEEIMQEETKKEEPVVKEEPEKEEPVVKVEVEVEVKVSATAKAVTEFVDGNAEFKDDIFSRELCTRLMRRFGIRP